MRTTDLIPLILLELNDGDKYGFELVKAIESKSNGKIEIKQPTLYTILKKLEKSKFISSYWQDSDIGGKRHYYKILDNGRMQVSTLPSYSALVASALANDISDEIPAINVANEEETNVAKEVQSVLPKSENNKNPVQETIEFKDFSAPLNYETDDSNNNQPAQNTLDNSVKTPSSDGEQLKFKESVLPSSEVFASNSIDTITETEQNLNNANILKSDSIKNDEQFATNSNVSTFATKNLTPLPEDYKNKLKETNFSQTQILNPQKVDSDFDNVKFIEYENIKTNSKYLHAKSVVKSNIYKILCNSAYLLVCLILCAIIAGFTHASALYYVFIILGVFSLIFYPTLFAFNLDNFIEKCQNNKYKSNLKLRTIFAVGFMVGVIIVCVTVNIALKKSAFANMFADFANFYAPIIISSVVCIDILFTYLFITKIHKL